MTQALGSINSAMQVALAAGHTIIITSPPYNAISDGIMDNTIIFQNAHDDLVNTTGGNIFVPPGTYALKSSVVWGNSNGKVVNLIGEGAGRVTTFKWLGNSTTPMFHLQGVRDSTFANFTILALKNVALLKYAFQSTTIVNRVATNNKFIDINVDGFDDFPNQSIETGFIFDAGSGGDVNNDVMTFERVQVFYTINAAFSFCHAQSKSHQFYKVDMGHGLYGIRTDEGPGSVGGSFRLFGGTMSWLTGAIFKLGAANNPILINGIDAENIGVLGIVNPGGEGLFPITVSNSSINWINSLPVDRRFFVSNGPGPFVFLNNAFTGSTGSGKIYLSSPSASKSVIAIGNIIQNDISSGDANWIESTGGAITSIGNIRENIDGTHALWPNIIT